MTIQKLKEKVLQGGSITREEALFLAEGDLDELSSAANEIREHFSGSDFDMCGVISLKNGQCSEDCRYCSQSTCALYKVEPHALLSQEEVLEHARLRAEQGVRHYCLVSVGRKMGNRELDRVCEIVRALCRETDLRICVSLGLLDEEQFRRLKDAGVKRIHNNLETSAGYFPQICTSHTYEDKLETLRAAKRTGVEICCGGIFGIGETMEDRIDMALTIRDLDVQSIPVNLLEAVPGTPMEHMPPLEDSLVQRIIAVYRFILPDKYIRLAAGRDNLKDTGIACFRSGSNAAITGDMLTVQGITVEQDLHTIRELGYTLN